MLEGGNTVLQQTACDRVSGHGAAPRVPVPWYY